MGQEKSAATWLARKMDAQAMGENGNALHWLARQVSLETGDEIVKDVIVIRTDEGRIGRCGPECYSCLTARKCTCICGGVNHGVGFRQAIENARLIKAEAINRANRLRELVGKKPLEVYIGQEQLRFF